MRLTAIFKILLEIKKVFIGKKHFTGEDIVFGNKLYLYGFLLLRQVGRGFCAVGDRSKSIAVDLWRGSTAAPYLPGSLLFPGR